MRQLFLLQESWSVNLELGDSRRNVRKGSDRRPEKGKVRSDESYELQFKWKPKSVVGLVNQLATISKRECNWTNIIVVPATDQPVETNSDASLPFQWTLLFFGVAPCG